MNGGDDQIGSGIFLVVKQVIEPHDDKTADRKKQNHPRMVKPETGGKIHRKINGCSAYTDDTAHDDCKYNPLAGNIGSLQIVFKLVNNDFFHDFFPHLL